MPGKLRSTSIHRLNADRGLGFVGKVAYLFLNFVNNLFPYLNLDKRIETRPYEGDWEKELSKTYPASSPSRRMSDIFWRTLPWSKIKAELGEIHIFDTGCGHGNYGSRLLDASDSMVSSYTGVDAKRRDNWKVLEGRYPAFEFIESTSNDISSIIPPQTNLFITQSAIEHFDYDLIFFEQIRAFIERSEKPVIQIHLFPAAANLPLNIFHGLRQYTPRTISKITRLFDDSSKFYLFGLAGENSKKIQWKYITWPALILRQKDLRADNIEQYEREVIEALRKDTKSQLKSPIFWALVIHSHPTSALW